MEKIEGGEKKAGLREGTLVVAPILLSQPMSAGARAGNVCAEAELTKQAKLTALIVAYI